MNTGSLGLILFVATLSALVTLRLCLSASILGRLDHPNDRSLHTRPTPRTGGLAIFGSLLVGLVLADVSGWAEVSFRDTAEPARAAIWLWIMGLTLLIGAISFWDDRNGLSPSMRFILHGAAAVALVWGTGMAISKVSLPLAGAWSLGILAAPLTILGLMWMANLYNFMDGMDGFAGGMTVLGFGALSYLSGVGGSRDLALVALLIAAAAGGFLVFNLPPARIFMGDVGSVPLGFLAGVLAVVGVRDEVFELWVPLLIFSPFVADSTATLFRRLLRGDKVWQAHREHYYQRLVLAGWSHRKTVLAEYALMLATGATAVLYVHTTEHAKLALLLAWATGYSILAWGVRVMEHGRNDRVSEA